MYCTAPSPCWSVLDRRTVTRADPSRRNSTSAQVSGGLGAAEHGVTYCRRERHLNGPPAEGLPPRFRPPRRPGAVGKEMAGKQPAGAGTRGFHRSNRALARGPNPRSLFRIIAGLMVVERVDPRHPAPRSTAGPHPHPIAPRTWQMHSIRPQVHLGPLSGGASPRIHHRA